MGSRAPTRSGPHNWSPIARDGSDSPRHSTLQVKEQVHAQGLRSDAHRLIRIPRTSPQLTQFLGRSVLEMPVAQELPVGAARVRLRKVAHNDGPSVVEESLEPTNEPEE